MSGRTTDYYVACVAVWPDGRQRAGNVAHVRLDSLETARQKLAAGKVAWVRREDVEQLTSVQIHG